MTPGAGHAGTVGNGMIPDMTITGVPAATRELFDVFKLEEVKSPLLAANAKSVDRLKGWTPIGVRAH